MSRPKLTIRIDHKLRIRIGDLLDEVRDSIAEALTIPNLEKLAAKDQHKWGWEKMPDVVLLYEIDYKNNELVMPRGFAPNLANTLRDFYGYEIDWIDNRVWEGYNGVPTSIDLRDYQSEAHEVIINSHQGIYKAPAGSGKTVTVISAMEQVKGKCIVIVNTKDILWQWRDRINTFIGESSGIVGDLKFEVHDHITIATAQTLHSRFDDLEKEGFFDEFSFVCLDECHHATANTYNRILDRFSARYRIGVSATPDKTGDFALATHILGPIIHETTPTQVDALMKPEVVQVATDFRYGFKPTRSRWQRSNYGQMIERLVSDPERNDLIVRAIMAEQGHHSLLITKRLEHIEILDALLREAGYKYPILSLTGQDKNEHREYVVDYMNKHPAICLSTLADEALDIPRLDRGFLVFPQKNSGLIVQQVGRFERIHPDKKDSKIYDFADLRVAPFVSQWRTRRFEVYEPRGYKITKMKQEEL